MELNTKDFNTLLYQVACSVADYMWHDYIEIDGEKEMREKEKATEFSLADIVGKKKVVWFVNNKANFKDVEQPLYTIKNSIVRIQIDNLKYEYIVDSAFDIAYQLEKLCRPASRDKAKFGVDKNGRYIYHYTKVWDDVHHDGNNAINADAHIAPKIKPEATDKVVIPRSTSYESVAYRYYEKAKAPAPKDSIVLVYHAGYIYFFGDEAHKALMEDVKRTEKKRHQKIELHLNKYNLNLQDKNINWTCRRYHSEEHTIIEECIANSERKYVLYEYGTLYDFTNLCRHYEANKIGDLKRRAQEAREASLIAGNETKTKTITKTKEESIAGAYLFLFFFDETAELEAA